MKPIDKINIRFSLDNTDLFSILEHIENIFNQLISSHNELIKIIDKFNKE